MTQRDLAINGVLFVAILAVVYGLVTFQPSELKGPGDGRDGAGGTEPIVSPETLPAPSADINAVAMRSLLVRTDPFRTIITPTPTPTPPPPTPKPLPRVESVMAQYELINLDPSRKTLQLQEKTSGNILNWTVNETKDLTFRNDTLPVTLKLIDASDYHADFTTPDDQLFTFRFF